MAHPGPAVSAAAPLRVCIDARLEDGGPGGVQQTIMGLASGLSALPGSESYLFLAHPGAESWLGPHLAGGCQLLLAEREPPPKRRSALRQALRQFDRRRRRFFRELRGKQLPPARIHDSDGTVERAGAEVMHFAMQGGFRTRLPTIYVPHDLQHLHLPELFTPEEHAWRAGLYRPMCEQARVTVALSRWGKEDLVRSFGLPPEKVRVIGWAPILAAQPEPTPADLAALRARHRLPEAFALFPAQSFKHKNHLGLLTALARLRDREGLRVPLVLAGRQNDHFPLIARAIRRLRLSDQVQALGFVTPLELHGLYRLARLLVFPSRFEGFGMPVIEAFHAGVPVATSSASCLREIAGDAALLFDPSSAEAMADAVGRLWREERLRAELAARGLLRSRAYTWDRVARSYRALYRQLAGRPLDAEDQRLLEETA